MTTGIYGTGPYGRIRSLRRDIKDFKYELELMARGIRRKSKEEEAWLRHLIEERRQEIREIQKQEKEKKS